MNRVAQGRHRLEDGLPISGPRPRVLAPDLRGLLLTLMLAGHVTAGIGRVVGSDWPQWRGPQRDARSAETGLLSEWPEDGPPSAWHAAGLGAGYSSVVVGHGMVFTMGRHDTAVIATALEERTGKVVWARRIGETSRHPSSTPTLDGELLYVLDPDGEMVCLQASSGDTVWETSLTEKFHGRMMSGRGYGESPLIDGEKLICTPGGPEAAMVALNKRTGDVLWQTTLSDPGPAGKDGAGFSSVVISQGAGVRQYVQLMGRGLVGIDAQDGRHLWSFNEIANGTANIPTPVVRGDSVFAANGYSSGSVLLRLSPEPPDATGRPRVRADVVYTLAAGEFQNHHGGVVLIGDHLFGGHGNNNGLPACLEFETGKIVWKRRGPGVGSAAVVAADGQLYFRYQNGLVALIEATSEGYRLNGRLQVPGAGGDSWAHPVVANGRLLLREQDMLWVYDLSREGSPLAATGSSDGTDDTVHPTIRRLRSAGASAEVLQWSDADRAVRLVPAGGAGRLSAHGRSTGTEVTDRSLDVLRYAVNSSSADPDRLTYRVVLSNRHLTPEGTVRDDLRDDLHQMPGGVVIVVAGTSITDAGVAQLAGPNIVGLSLELCTGVTAAGFQALSQFPQLKLLILAGTRISAQDLNALETLPHLAALDLELCDGISDSACASLGRMTSLKSLDFRKSGFEPERITGAGLRQLRTLTRLETLVLYGNQITDADLGELSPLNRLRQLDLSLLPITDAGLASLAPLESLEQLDLLYSEGFAGPMLTDNGIAALASLSQLEELDLTGARLTDAGLIPLGRLSRLRLLQLVRTRVTEQGVEAFRESLPDCQAVR